MMLNQGTVPLETNPNVQTQEIETEVVYSGEPLPMEFDFPITYIHTNGEPVVCHTKEALLAAEQYDLELTIYPPAIMILGLMAAMAIAVYFY